MIFGLPLTGLGSLFYLILTIWMPVREAHRTVRGKGCPRRWKQIAVSCSLMAGLFITMFTQAWLISLLIPGASSMSSQAMGTADFDRFAGAQTGGLVAGAIIVSFITLIMVAIVVHSLRIGFQVRAHLRSRAANQAAVARA